MPDTTTNSSFQRGGISRRAFLGLASVAAAATAAGGIEILGILLRPSGFGQR